MLKQLAVESDRQEQRPASLEYVLSAESKNVLAYAEELAQRDSQKLVGTVHLLMGLLREEAGLAAKVLRQHGVELSRIRSEFS
jgi:ATP-dependent Clp protease ATP-binding subunit ClpC